MKPNEQGLMLVAALATLLRATPAFTAETADRGAQTAVAASNAFGLRLYAKLRVEKGNLFFSPYSVSTALAMTYAGARGETQRAMANALAYPFSEEGRHLGMPGGPASCSPTPSTSEASG